MKLFSKDAKVEYGAIDARCDDVSKESHLMAKCDSNESNQLPHTIFQKMISEVMGTFVLVLFGCGAVCNTKYTHAMSGLGQTTMTWALGGSLAIYTCGTKSGGHLNPAVSLAFALVRPKEFPMQHFFPYAIAQVIGAFAAAAVNFYLFSEAISSFEAESGFIRDTNGHSFGGAFGCYWSQFVATGTQALLTEIVGTAMLTFVVFSITNKANNVPTSFVPALVGIAIGSIIAVTGSLSGGAINPARDVGPRFFTLIAGWGTYGFEGTWVYVVGPFIGGPIGALISDFLLHS